MSKESLDILSDVIRYAMEKGDQELWDILFQDVGEKKHKGYNKIKAVRYEPRQSHPAQKRKKKAVSRLKSV